MIEKNFTVPTATQQPNALLDRIPDTLGAGCSCPASPRLAGPLLEAIPAPAFIINTSPTVVASKTRFCKYIGLPQPSVLDAETVKAVPPEAAAHFHKTGLELLAEGGARVYDAEVNHINGTKTSIRNGDARSLPNSLGIETLGRELADAMSEREKAMRDLHPLRPGRPGATVGKVRRTP